MVQIPSQGLSHAPSALTAHRRTHRSSRCAHHTTCSCLMTPCESPSCWKLGWQMPPQGPCRQAEHRGDSTGKLWYSQIPAMLSRAGWGCFKVPSMLTEGQMTSGNPAPASCPAWLSAWLLPSPVSWHSPSGTQNRESEEERASSAKPPKAQLWEKKNQSTSQAWKKGREEGQENWDRFKSILRRQIRPGSYLRNEVLNQ